MAECQQSQRECSLCLQTKRDLYSLTGNRSFKHGIIEKIKNVISNDIVTSSLGFACVPCWNKISGFFSYKETVLQNLSRPSMTAAQSQRKPLSTATKRHLNTPPRPNGPTNKRRMSVAQQILSSIEKPDRSTPGPTVVLKHSNIRRRLQFTDHEYACTSRIPTTAESTMEKTTEIQKCMQSNENLLLVKEIQASISRLSCNGVSILFKKSADILSNECNFYEGVMDEIKCNIPLLFEILTAVVGKSGSQKATISTIYGMIMHSHNMQASAIQRLMTTLAIKCHADNKLLSRLNKIHITLSAESKKNLIKEFGKFSEEKVVEAVASGKDGKINGDNVDIFVRTNDIRMTNQNKDYHFFASDWSPFRLTDADFSENFYLKNRINSRHDSAITLEKLSPTEDQLKQYKENTKILVARVLLNHCPAFKWLDVVLPKHIKHELSEIMSRKSDSFRLKILLKNETKHADCVEIMDSYVEQVSNWYKKAGREDDLNHLKVPVGGDQLTRTRLDVAKSLRMGAHTTQERLELLYPVIVEFFHLQMDFLEKIIKKFMRKTSGRDIATLSHLKTIIQRSNVNGNVKSRFKAHEDFVLLIGQAYILEAAIEHFGMDSTYSVPTKHSPPNNISKLHKEKREGLMHDLLDCFLDNVLGPLNFEQESTNRTLATHVGEEVIHAKIQDGKALLQFHHSEKAMKVALPATSLEKGNAFYLSFNNSKPLKIVKAGTDDLHNYIKNFLHYYLLYLNFKDAIEEGDVSRVNIIMKLMIPCFYGHSSKSKYMVECVDYILKTELLLPSKLALQVQTASFFNPKGEIGKNKPSDLEKENQVKELKDLIKSLGANKTESSIIAVSKAAPVINNIVSNLDEQIDFCNINTTHKSKTDNEDLHAILQTLHKARPFSLFSARTLNDYNYIKSSIYSELFSSQSDFNCAMLNIAARLKRGIAINFDEENDQSDVDIFEDNILDEP